MPADRLFHPRLGHSEKVTGLSDLEFRVWVIYQLTSDDYGVMRKSSVTIQASDDSLASRPAKAIEAALKRLVSVGLLDKFDHQGRTYVYQRDWQNFQRVKHPRDTMQPAPPEHLIARCSPPTQKLFGSHPTTHQKDVGNISEMDLEEKSELGSLACARERETANGEWLPANGLEGVQGDLPPMDLWARELVNLYPAQGRCGWNLVERPLFAALSSADGPVFTAWEALKARLEQHKRSHQWRIKGMIPRLDKWLRNGLYLQELPEEAPAAERLSKSSNRTIGGAAEILKEPA